MALVDDDVDLQMGRKQHNMYGAVPRSAWWSLSSIGSVSYFQDLDWTKTLREGHRNEDGMKKDLIRVMFNRKTQSLYPVKCIFHIFFMFDVQTYICTGKIPSITCTYAAVHFMTSSCYRFQVFLYSWKEEVGFHYNSLIAQLLTSYTDMKN